MANTIDNFPQIVRTDALTRVGNHVGFFEWLLSTKEEKQIAPFSLMSTEVRGLKALNDASGREAGDTALRWSANVLKESTKQRTYRMGNEFLSVIRGGSPQEHAKLSKHVFDRLNNEAGTVGLQPPAANLALIGFTSQQQCTPENILSAYYGALFALKGKTSGPYMVFDAGQMKPVTGFLAYVVYHTVSRITSIGNTLDLAYQIAHFDPISGMPNMQAAVEEIKSAIQTANEVKQPFSILVVDGDTLSQYNKLSYSGGDEMIKKLGETLKGEMRPSDFIARWRTGDQFLVVLPNSVPQSAAGVGERMRSTVEKISKDWMIHSTISVGVASFPQHGKTPQKLVEIAEAAVKRAKEQGKNRVAVF